MRAHRASRAPAAPPPETGREHDEGIATGGPQSDQCGGLSRGIQRFRAARDRDAGYAQLFAGKSASLRVLRWKRFVQGEENQFMANTRKFTQVTAVPVRVDSENFEDIRPKAAVAANVGSGSDVVFGGRSATN